MDAIVPGVSFETIIRTAAKRGLIPEAEGRIDGWVADRMARHRNPSGPLLRQRSFGRWLQVNERKTESGGTVAAYADMSMAVTRPQNRLTNRGFCQVLTKT